VIAVSEPWIGEAEGARVLAALQRGELSGTHGIEIPTFEQRFADLVGVRHGVATSSGTTALHLAVAAAEIGPGDEVLVSASTNIATALAAVHNGAVPVPVDSEPETRNLDLDLLEALITPRTRAVIPVHLYGQPVDMDRLNAIANKHNLLVIEDCAEAHGATVRGRSVGSFGHMACYSFYANKIITTGEGGMVVTDDDALAAKLRLLRNLAFTTPRFRHEVLGYNFRMTALQAALGNAQLDRFDAILAGKRRVADSYNRLLAAVAGLRLPPETNWSTNVHWMYALEVQPDFGCTRDELLRRLASQEIEARTFFCPMNQQPCLIALPGFRVTPCPVADRLWLDGVYLPSSAHMDDAQIEFVAAAVSAARS
jgi:perosamine synthetase